MLRFAQLLCIFLCAGALFGCTKTDPVSVANYVRDEISQQFPKAVVDHVSDTEVAVTHADGNRQMIDLLPVQEGCKRVPRGCGRMVGELLTVMQDGLARTDSTIKLADVMPVISPPVPFRAVVTQNGPSKMRVDMIADGLAIRYATAMDGTLTFLDDEKLKALGVAPDALLRIALENVEADADVNVTAFPGEADVHQIFGRFASIGLLTQKHADHVRAQLKCTELAVAFPRRGMVLIADAANQNGVTRLREISKRFLQPSSAVISNEIYLITTRGIAVIQP